MEQFAAQIILINLSVCMGINIMFFAWLRRAVWKGTLAHGRLDLDVY